ncbi:AI-2E family transporter [Leptothermofonsia sichuanensis E412]|uniref:AI-2E family transporter n=1 Tax=Leptothermofonsia sichuanensis TaxID=2917832 RepID=UPI001CA6F883|nr:AI-2E family transporter [Leptothermofonsia sichuanensis]QZZ18943.1 AI-2E family transporter [Leptothermofonsia sichuanensis E412]
MFESLSKLPRQFTIGLTFPIIFLNLWLLLVLVEQLQPLVSILIVATLIAFLLDYPIRFLQQLGLRRSFSVGIVLLVALLILAVLVLVLVPLILQQANELIIRLPDWLRSGQQQLTSLEDWAVAQQLPIDLRATINQLIERLTSVLRSLTREIISLAFSAIGSIVNVFLTIVFAVFLVLRGESLWQGILGWLPTDWSSRVRLYLPQNFERYIVGQVTMASILAIIQSTALFILGTPLALLFGFMIGIGSIIPFGGLTTIIIVSLLVALQNFWLGVKVLVVAIVITQISENAIAPRIVGDLIGLNPTWMLISLFIGVKLGGVVGLIVTVPVASFIKGTFDTIRAQGLGLSLGSLESATVDQSTNTEEVSSLEKANPRVTQSGIS